MGALAYLRYVTIASFDPRHLQWRNNLVAWESLIGWFACVNFVYQIYSNIL